MKFLLNSKIPPKCGYCLRGKPTRDGSMVLCEKRGIVPPHFKCRKFRYDPLLREPKGVPEMPHFDPSDFKI